MFYCPVVFNLVSQFNWVIPLRDFPSGLTICLDDKSLLGLGVTWGYDPDLRFGDMGLGLFSQRKAFR